MSLGDIKIRASMGPRPDGRGRAAGAETPGIEALRQWGRGRMAAEGAPAAMPSSIRALRQWGRGRMAAEGGEPGQLREVERLVRQWGRGRMAAEGPAGRPASRPVSMRQWGRGRMAAEGGRSSTLQSTRTTSVNGAAAGWPRKVADPSALCDITGASMGPRPDGRGRTSARSSRRSASKRQWGRGRMAAEGWSAFTTPARRCRRQWGRGRMAAEGCNAPLATGRATSVNGAAAGWPRKVGWPP